MKFWSSDEVFEGKSIFEVKSELLSWRLNFWGYNWLLEIMVKFVKLELKLLTFLGNYETELQS